MNAPIVLDDERTLLTDALHNALVALEAGDESTYQHHIASLSALRERPISAALSRLAREFADTLGHLPMPPKLINDVNVAELPDACARLEHVVALTEQASHRTLDLVERSRDLVTGLSSEQLSPAAQDILGQVRRNLSEMALAQEYQDLTGQIIRRVVELVRRMQDALFALGYLPATPEETSAASGPAVPGVDRHATSQVDADSLLSDLGI
jgi:chemotaxis protein CheZ